jgi:hypothetical protein
MPHMASTRYALGRSGWVVAALAAVRVAVPLLVLAGAAVPGLPVYDYDGLTGDATGFYAAVRELLAAWTRFPAPVVGAVALSVAAGGVALGLWWRRNARARPWVVVAASVLAAAVACLAISRIDPPGAAVIGWPLVWSVPLLPYRALGLPLGPDGAYVVAVALSLAANAAAVVATAYLGLFATGRRSVAVVAAGLVALWPFGAGALLGDSAWENGTWVVEAGLAAYTEPLSTALVVGALVLVLAQSRGDVPLALAGAALGLATAVKLTNGLLAAAALLLVVGRVGPRGSLPFALAGLAFVPVVALFWERGYPAILDEDPDAWPDAPFSLSYATSAWTDSQLFTPAVALVLGALVLAGAVALADRWAAALLVTATLVNPVVYSLYWVTAQHPRFMFASLPPAFVLVASALVAGADRARSPGDRVASQAT